MAKFPPPGSATVHAYIVHATIHTYGGNVLGGMSGGNVRGMSRVKSLRLVNSMGLQTSPPHHLRFDNFVFGPITVVFLSLESRVFSSVLRSEFCILNDDSIY